MLNGLLSPSSFCRLLLLASFNPLTHDSNLFLAGHANGWRGSESHLMCVLIQGVGCLFPVGTGKSTHSVDIFLLFIVELFIFSVHAHLFTHLFSVGLKGPLSCNIFLRPQPFIGTAPMALNGMILYVAACELRKSIPAWPVGTGLGR